MVLVRKYREREAGNAQESTCAYQSQELGISWGLAAAHGIHHFAA